MRRTYSTLAVFAVLFALIICAGGCGGSSDHSSRTAVYLGGALHGEMASYLAEQAELLPLSASGSKDIVMLSYADGVNSAEIAAAQLKTAFENGSVVALEHANENEVNQLLAALGEEPDFDLSSADKDQNVEIYATARRGKDIFTYITRSDNNQIAAASVDVSGTFAEEESSSEKISTDVPASGTAISSDAEAEAFQQRLRVENFLAWANGLDGLGRQIDSANASDSDLTKLAQAHVVQNDYSKDGRRFILTHVIYACHSFADGSDWYLVQESAQLNPSAKYSKQHLTNQQWAGHNYKTAQYDVVAGYISGYTMNQWMDDGSSGIDSVSTVDSAPENINASQTKTTGFSWNVGGSVGVSGGKPAASISAGATFSTSETVTIYDYNIENQSGSSMTANTQWLYSFRRPADGSKNWYFRHLDDAVLTSRTLLQPHQQWIWKVSSAYRDKMQNAGQQINGTFRWTEGRTRGAFGVGWWIYPAAREDRDTNNDNSFSIALRRPPRIAADKAAFDFSAEAGHDTLGILSEKTWTAASDSGWCRINKTSGAGTKDNRVQILIEVDKNDSGAARTAYITITDGFETAKIEVVQSRY